MCVLFCGSWVWQAAGGGGQGPHKWQRGGEGGGGGERGIGAHICWSFSGGLELSVATRGQTPGQVHQAAARVPLTQEVVEW